MPSALASLRRPSAVPDWRKAGAAAAGGPGGFQGAGGGGGFGGGGFGGRGGGGGGFAGGRGGGRRPGGPAGRGGFIGNRRNAGQNQIRGSIFYTVDNSVTDASPFSLNGQTNTKAPYAQNQIRLQSGRTSRNPQTVSLGEHFLRHQLQRQSGAQRHESHGHRSHARRTRRRFFGDLSRSSTIPLTGLPFSRQSHSAHQSHRRRAAGLHPAAESAGDR